jgi:hypothetical protein
MKFSSEYADTATELLALKTEAFGPVSEKKKRLRIVREFTNMVNTMTKAEAEEAGITEMTNHGMTHRAMMQNQSMYKSMVSVTNALVEVVVDTDNPEVDLILSQRISEAINRHAIHHKGRFGNFWEKVAGELVIAGGGAVVQSETYGYMPSLRMDMVFPSESSLDPEEITYAFDPKELTVGDLVKLEASVKNDDGVYVQKGVLSKLLKKLRENIKDQVSSTLGAYSSEISRGTRTDHIIQTAKVPAWEFFEIKYDDKGEQYVSKTLLVDTTEYIPNSKGDAVQIIAYREKAYENANDWLNYPYVDSEIGGVKNIDTVKGVAEMQYPSALDMEELKNLIIEGAKLRARPLFTVTNEANVDDLAKWDAAKSMFMPPGVADMQIRGNANELGGMLSLLSQNANGMAQTESQGSSDRLRVEALQGQRENAALTSNKLSDAYNHLDSILETVVHRLLTAKTKPGTEGYRDIMAVRDRLDKYNIDYKELAKRKHGRFVNLRVRAVRSIGNGDRQMQLDTADWFLENIQFYEPANRPKILRQATMLRSQDPDWTDSVVVVPQAIINAQKITAENEADTIFRRAALGQILPIAADDIHQDHIPIHMVDLQALIALNDLDPWTKKQIVQFAGLVEHTGMHMTTLLENPRTNGEAKGLMQDYQTITQMGQAIAAQVQEAEGAGGELTAKEQLDAQMKMSEMQLRARQQGLKERQQDSIEAERERNFGLKTRGQMAKEVLTDKQIELQRKNARTYPQT